MRLGRWLSLLKVIVMKKVTKHTRAGNGGKEIICPHCNNHKPVYHFSWSSLQCTFCKSNVDKYDWLLAESHDPPI